MEHTYHLAMSDKAKRDTRKFFKALLRGMISGISLITVRMFEITEYERTFTSWS